VYTVRKAVGRMRLVLGTLSVASAAGLTGCDAAVTSPGTMLERENAPLASALQVPDARRQVFRGPSGRVFVLDVETSTLSEPGGGSVRLSARDLQSVQRIFEGSAQFAERIQRLQADPQYRARVAASPLLHARARIRLGARGASRRTALAAPSKFERGTARRGDLRPLVDSWQFIGGGTRAVESDICRDISEQIYILTKAYNDAQETYEQLLIEMVGMGVSVSVIDGLTYNPEGAVGTYAARLTWAAFVAMELKIKLDYLAIQYSLNGCWEPGWEDTSAGSSGDGSQSASTTTSTATCHTEWIVVEVSSDGGATWSTSWEGWATVCE
jgi:hypothetical protein